MSTPETKDLLRMYRMTKAAENLWQQAVAGVLKSNSPRLESSLQFLDRLTEQQFGRAFAETFRERHFLVEDVVSINREDYHYNIGYSNEEADQGLRFLRASWASEGWILSLDIYHLAGYHRLHQVIIVHGDKQVMFLYPEKFKGKSIPANTLPTDIEVKNLVSA